jgi:hypothetical protein
MKPPPNPQGRVDILFMGLCGRLCEQIERDRGIVGLRENILPLIERTVVPRLPQYNVFPKDLQPLLRVYLQNSRGQLR